MQYIAFDYRILPIIQLPLYWYHRLPAIQDSLFSSVKFKFPALARQRPRLPLSGELSREQRD
jgi:hypothetical protein